MGAGSLYLETVPAMLRRVAAAIVFVGVCTTAGSPLRAEEPRPVRSPPAVTVAGQSHDDVRRRFIHGAFALQSAAGQTLGKRWVGATEPDPLAEQDVLKALAGHELSDIDAAALWEMLAGASHTPFLSLALIDAAVAATVSPVAREAMWGELAALSDRLPREENDPTRSVSLIGLFERHRPELLPRFTAVADTVGGGDEMVKLMLATRIFGATTEESVAFLAKVSPAALDRRIERDRSAGKPVSWQSNALLQLGPWYEARRAAELAAASAPALTEAEIRHRFIHGAFTFYDAAGNRRGVRHAGRTALPLSEPAVIKAFAGHHLSAEDASALWEMLASEEHVWLLSLPLLQAVIAATDTTRAREALWSELSALAARLGVRSRRPEPSLIGLFELHAADLKPLLTEVHESEGGGDEMVKLMLSTKIFGTNLNEGLTFIAARNPAALARMIERERGRGKPVAWERTAYELFLKWKNDRLLPGAPLAPKTFAALDAMGEQLISILNALHDFDDSERKKLVDGLGPAEVFNVIVAGEQELYRLGTSSYRKFLHPVVLAGLKQSGSFEEFLRRISLERFGEEAARVAARRGIIFLRVASSFGMIDPILESVRDRAQFIDDVIATLGDPSAFEANSSVLMEVLTAPSGSRALAQFKQSLLSHLYKRYSGEPDVVLRSVYGSMLSVYQTVTGDHRDQSIDRTFALDTSIFRVPFERLFSQNGRGAYAHRMFMRMDQDTDALASYAGFRARMQLLGAARRDEKTFEVFTLRSLGRTIEIYVNKPSETGNKKGITDIAAALAGRRVETVIGRGHTQIITPLQADAKRIAGDRIGEVAAVLVGTCGGDASVREMIGTFGYKPFFATKATGRGIINNAIIEAYVSGLRAMRPGDRLSMPDVLTRALTPFLRTRSNEELRTDAALYEANLTTVYASYLFNAHVRTHLRHPQHAAR